MNFRNGPLLDTKSKILNSAAEWTDCSVNIPVLYLEKAK